MVVDSVLSKLSFAQNRLDAICELVHQGQIASDSNLRQQLSQEFFFHSLGAIEYLAQLVNEKRNIGLNVEDVAVYQVCNKLKNLNPSDPLLPILSLMSINTRKKPFPDDPYSDYGLMYRLINYRNEVVHRNTNPFHFASSGGPCFAEFWLDPRDHTIGKSGTGVDVDLTGMYKVVSKSISDALGKL